VVRAAGNARCSGRARRDGGVSDGGNPDGGGVAGAPRAWVLLFVGGVSVPLLMGLAMAAVAAEAGGGGGADAVSAEWLAAAMLLGVSHKLEYVGGLLAVRLVWAVWDLTRMRAWGSMLSGSRCPANGRLLGGPDVRIVGSQLGGGGGSVAVLGTTTLVRRPAEVTS